LHVHLQDKSVGQQQVRFVAKVKKQSLDALPSLITQLVDSQSAEFVDSPLIKLFKIFFTKQYGENIVAQLIDGGYQVSFELPLAIAASAVSADNIILENTNVMLLSNNTMLAELLENIVLSAKGKFEKIARIDSFQQQLNAKHLNRHKLDVLVVASDIALIHLDLITQKIDDLPQSLQPKLMVLQSAQLNFERFGFYSQTEQILCKENLLHDILALLASNDSDNRLLPFELFTTNQYIECELPLLLGVQAPQHSQNLQRLLDWLGFQVQIVASEARQKSLWQTGQYSLLITEFAESALLEMTSKPLIDVGVFSLSEEVPRPESSKCFEKWHISKLSKESTLAELIDALSPWLKKPQLVESGSVILQLIMHQRDKLNTQRV